MNKLFFYLTVMAGMAVATVSAQESMRIESDGQVSVLYKGEMVPLEHHMTGYGNTVVEITDGTDQTVTLPSAASTDYPVFIMRKGSGGGKLTIRTTGSEYISHEGQDVTSIELDESKNIGIEFISDGLDWNIRSTIGCELMYIESELECVFTKYYLGTTDSDSITIFNHGVNVDHILHCSASVWDGSYGNYLVYSIGGADPSEAYALAYSDIYVRIVEVQSSLRSQNYRSMIIYYN